MPYLNFKDLTMTGPGSVALVALKSPRVVIMAVVVIIAAVLLSVIR